ncbi:phosphonate ABC transporter substrate-binding protein [Iningainema tapete]|uniref:Phosphonate ABC transporter substrate-binding protein n=1 Tax=Iningainema tapete BLCC-T55 TaxID=2748662 RepID=A0A8J6XI30_9CYAN|nr:phosphonate ABC transporter substrate-binding protein [Iningainema tapete]MBD2772706.1 phosphonate ABC transporter substrate-binding protein [Iningainema tapete BLCC-T55]
MFYRKFVTTAVAVLPVLAIGSQVNPQTMGSLLQGQLNLPVASAQNRPIVMGLIPAENNQEMVQKFEPMRAYLEKKLNRPVKVFTATDYAGVIEAMRRDRVDIAWFGPLSYVLAEQEAGAEAFAVGVRKNGQSTYRSIFVVPGDSPIKSLQDLKGKSVAFVDPASTSGALVPSFIVKKTTGKLPQEFFGKLTYAGSHDAAQLAVKNRTVDAAADNDITYEKMLSQGLITKQSNRVLLTSDPLPGSPLVYRNDLDAATKQKIRDAILGAHKEIQVTGYGDLLRYDAVTPSKYQPIRDMVQQLGLRREQMLK